MNKATITFKFMSYWHMGSGFGEGAHLDAVPVKSAAGLPYLPGKTVKGLLREAVLTAEECDQLPQGSTDRLFGSRDDNKSRYETDPGELRFTSATLGGPMEEWAADNGEATQLLYVQLASTRIDDKGLAHDRTLRKIEVAVPVLLTGEIESTSADKNWLHQLRHAVPLIRQAGSHRHRGLGRVEVTIKEVQA